MASYFLKNLFTYPDLQCTNTCIQKLCSCKSQKENSYLTCIIYNGSRKIPPENFHPENSHLEFSHPFHSLSFFTLHLILRP